MPCFYHAEVKHLFQFYRPRCLFYVGRALVFKINKELRYTFIYKLFTVTLKLKSHAHLAVCWISIGPMFFAPELKNKQASKQTKQKSWHSHF